MRWLLISGLLPLLAFARKHRLSAIFGLLLLGLGHRAACAAKTASAPAPSHALVTVKQVHQMGSEAAARHLPIRLRGVVTTISAYPNAFFMQDATAGISLEGDQLYEVYPGASVEVSGETAPGLFAPVVKVTNVRVLGPGKLPVARLHPYHELVGGLEDSNWIALRGVVRSARPRRVWETDVLAITLDVDGTLVEAQLMDLAAAHPEELVDAVVTLRGVCTTSFNDKRQFTGIGLIVPSMKFVTVNQAAAPDPFSSPPTPVRSLLQFRPGVRFGHRVLVNGTVTFEDPGHTLYIEDGGDGVLVETEQNVPLPLGSRIAVVGFPASGAYSPILRQAVFRTLPAEKPVVPVALRENDFLRRGKFITAPYDAQLVILQGQLVEVTSRLNDDAWLVRDGNSHFVAILKRRPGAPPPPAIEIGSRVAVTGIFTVQLDEARDPTSFRVLLRSATDLQVLQRASWWSPAHALSVLFVVLAGTLAIALWVAVLRRTVRQQTQLLRASEERFRDQAEHDALTGLVSRSFLREQLHNDIRQARRAGEKMALLMIDLDHFKQVNDTLGHHAGDELLCLVAHRIRASVRKTDTVGRMGGDEFVVLLTNIHNRVEAEEIGAKVVANVSAPATLAGAPIPVSASVGVCLYPEGGADPDTLLQNVDAAMYKAKAAGRNSFAVYADDKTKFANHGLLTAALNR